MNAIAKAALGHFGTGLSVFALVGLTFLASVAYIILWFMLLTPILGDWIGLDKDKLSVGTEAVGSFDCSPVDIDVSDML